jgi:hypothetical protein
MRTASPYDRDVRNNIEVNDDIFPSRQAIIIDQYIRERWFSQPSTPEVPKSPPKPSRPADTAGTPDPGDDEDPKVTDETYDKDSKNHRKNFEFQGEKVEINSGHAYNRSHKTGDIRNTGISMDEVDKAIVRDVVKRKNEIDEIKNMKEFTVNITGHDIKYKVFRDGNKFRVPTYYP